MKKTFSLRSLAALAATALLLAACGGGGGGGGGSDGGDNFVDPPPSARFGASSSFANTCDLETQKKFVRSYMDEVYLWYNEIPEVDPAAFGTIPEYFHALRVRTPDANGQPRDRFSTVVPASQALNLSPLPLQDGSTLLANHTSFVGAPVTFNSSNGRVVGYLQFVDHDIGAQDDLITAFRELQSRGVQDLVLDLRRNSGGFLYIALAAASMITGPASNGQVFERLQFNDKRSVRTERSTLLFSGQVQFAETQYPIGTTLPQLGLPRVFVLTSGTTCSASESIINALRGIDVQVIRIGSTTCGKPYGFEKKENCGWAFFPIEFQGTNAKGFGDYTTGFAPTCQVSDDPTKTAGGTDDPLLNAARFYIENGSCPSGTATGVQSAASPRMSSEQPRRASWAGRLLLPQQR